MKAIKTHMTTEETPTLVDFIKEQSTDPERQAAAQREEHPSLQYHYDCGRLLVRNALIDLVLQNVVSIFLRSKTLCLSYYPALAGHAEELRM